MPVDVGMRIPGMFAGMLACWLPTTGAESWSATSGRKRSVSSTCVALLTALGCMNMISVAVPTANWAVCPAGIRAEGKESMPPADDVAAIMALLAPGVLTSESVAGRAPLLCTVRWTTAAPGTSPSET